MTGHLVYNGGKEWIPIFAISRQFPVLNGTVTFTQFPLKPPAASRV